MMRFIDYTQMTGCERSTEKELLAVRGKIGHWDAVDRPPVADYAEFRSWLAEELSGGPQWWDYPGAEGLFTPSQGALGSCAGFAVSNAATITLIHQVQMASEQLPEKINPFVCWCLSKGHSTRGGQTMSAMALAANEAGQWPVRIAGEYSENLGWDSRWETEESKRIAAEHQIGIAEIPYSGKELAEEIRFLCQHRRAVFFGATACLSETGKITRCGGHAQVFGGYDEATDSVGYVNSWGNLYTGLPVGFAAKIDRATLERFCQYLFDPYVVTYAECPYDADAEVTLTV